MNIVILKDVRLNDEEMYYINNPLSNKLQYILVDFNFFILKFVWFKGVILGVSLKDM